jgi:hypothetical protein
MDYNYRSDSRKKNVEKKRCVKPGPFDPEPKRDKCRKCPSHHHKKCSSSSSSSSSCDDVIVVPKCHRRRRSCSSSSSSESIPRCSNPFPVVLSTFTITSTVIPAAYGSSYTIPAASFSNSTNLLPYMYIAYQDSACNLTFGLITSNTGGLVTITTTYQQAGFNGQILKDSKVYLFGFTIPPPV